MLRRLVAVVSERVVQRTLDRSSMGKRGQSLQLEKTKSTALILSRGARELQT